MPSTVASLFEAADLASSGVVNWRTRVPAIEPGVYVVSIESEVDREGGLSQCPIAQSACDLLLTARPELTLDRGRPEASELAARISGFWFADEVVVYAGLAGTSLADRVSAYYRTKLGARRPHAGGWFLKTLEILPELSVHYAACQDPDQAEHDMLAAFAARVSKESRKHLHDSEHVMPFANLEFPKGTRKDHGIRGATEPRSKPKPKKDEPLKEMTSVPPSGATDNDTTPHLKTQRVTAADLGRRQIRIPPGASKSAFPAEPKRIKVRLRGSTLDCRWDPSYGPPERSGVIGVGKAKLNELVVADEVLRVEVTDAFDLT